ncbi:MAG: hypothetical protein NC831_09080 [Candidatus Omnitrophica bacterium]|nr:hypothetical protein [Candidatus Omnitrophota bacterium]
MKRTIIIVAIAAALLNSVSLARTKFVALPERAETIIRLDNPLYTLVEEERTLPLQKGTNQVDFSWTGVSIDPDSIRIKILSHPELVKLVSVSYPPGENALVWQIYSPEAFEEKIRISYLLKNIDRIITYKAVADKNESRVNLQSYLVLRNFSGEDFSSAKILLDYGETFEKSVAHEETRQMLLLTKNNVPIEKKFTFDARILPWDPEKVSGNVGIPVSYEIKNDRKSGLGEFGLWGGKARIFQDDGHGSTIFVGEDNAGYTPVGEKCSLYVGDSRDIVVTQRKIKDSKINVRRNNSGSVVLYDTDEIIRIVIENFKDAPANLTLIQEIPGEWDMEETSHQYEKEDANLIKFYINLAPKAKETVTFHYHRRNVR